MMHDRFSAPDRSLNVVINPEDNDSEWQDRLEDDTETHEDHFMERDEMDKRQEMLKAAMQSLNSREFEILQGRRLDDPPKTLETLSRRLNISRERVRQLEQQAFRKLKKTIAMEAMRA